MDYRPPTPDLDDLDFIGIAPYGMIPVAGRDQVPLEVLEDYAQLGQAFETNAELIDEECVKQLSVFMNVLQLLLRTHDIEAVLALLQENNLYFGSVPEPTPYYIHVLLRPELFSPDDVLYLFTSLKAPKTVDVNGKIIQIPPDMRLTKEDVYYKIVGLNDVDYEKLIDIWELVEAIYQRIDSTLDAEFYKSVRQVQFEYNESDYPLDYFICERIADGSPFASVPSYIIEVEEPANIKEILNDLTTRDDSYVLNINRLPSEIRQELNTNPGRAQYYRENYATSRTRFALEKSLFLNRLFGPINRRTGDELLANDVCSIYGGCRMLICPCLEGNDWFRGYCMTCFNRIKHVSSALRVPALEGRWRGCYCSFECTESAIREENRAELPFDMLNTAMIQYKLSQLNNLIPLYFFYGSKKIIQTTGIFNMNNNDPIIYTPDGAE